MFIRSLQPFCGLFHFLSLAAHKFHVPGCSCSTPVKFINQSHRHTQSEVPHAPPPHHILPASLRGPGCSFRAFEGTFLWFILEFEYQVLTRLWWCSERKPNREISGKTFFTSCYISITFYVYVLAQCPGLGTINLRLGWGHYFKFNAKMFAFLYVEWLETWNTEFKNEIHIVLINISEIF